MCHLANPPLQEGRRPVFSAGTFGMRDMQLFFMLFSSGLRMLILILLSRVISNYDALRF